MLCYYVLRAATCVGIRTSATPESRGQWARPVASSVSRHLSDRPPPLSRQLSLTFQVKLEGATAWPLIVLDPRGQELSNLNASGAKSVVLENNDGMLYYGPDIVHWREPQPHTLTQIVFAFREEDEAHCNNQ